MPRRKFFLQTFSDVETRSRGYLPHWNLRGATYSVTFRLEGSLPSAVLAALTEHHSRAVRMITGGIRKLTPFEAMELRARFERDLDEKLHAHQAIAFMNDERVADVVASTLTHFDGSRYRLDAWCVMPNHVHCGVCA